MSLGSKRKTYKEIKSSLLDAYFTFARDLGLVFGQPFVQVIGAVSSDYEGVFALPVENIMRGIVTLVLSAGRFPEPEANIRKKIRELIASNGLENILADLPQDEKKELLHDLKVLKLLDQ
jgi:hypothetical protein